MKFISMNFNEMKALFKCYLRKVFSAAFICKVYIPVPATAPGLSKLYFYPSLPDILLYMYVFIWLLSLLLEWKLCYSLLHS